MFKTLSVGAKSTWLCIPGVGSFSSSFEPIAKSLGALDIGLDAVELIEVFKGNPHLHDIGDVAELISSVRPDLFSAGSYTIVGHSFGGRIAYELGRRRAALGLEAHVVMIDALPRNFDGVKEPEGTSLSDPSLLRWYVSTFPAAFAAKFSGVPDAELADALVSSRVFRRNDIADFTDAMRRQIVAHNSYRPQSPVSNQVRLDVVLPEAGIFADRETESIQNILAESVDDWSIHKTPGDHYSILKMPEDIIRSIS